MRFTIKKKRVLKYLFVLIGLLLIGNIIAVYISLNYSNDEFRKIRILFDFNLERNLPTYFSSMLLLGNALLLSLIGYRYKAKGEKYIAWLGLAAIFVFLSVDETIQIHEQLRNPMEAMFNASGLLYFAWFIPYGIVVTLIGITYFKFTMRLPKPVLRLFVLAAILFLGGAIGMEAVGGMYSEQFGETSLAYRSMYTIEELMEMSGSAVFFYALVLYITTQFNNLIVNFPEPNSKMAEA